MKLFKTAIFTALFAAISAMALISHIGVAHAATQDNCAFTTADFDKITAIQNDPSLSASEEITQELAVRRQLIAETIVCGRAEVTTLQNTLQNATATEGTQSIQSQLVSSLNGALDFYTAENSRLNDAGIAGTKMVAREVMVWRNGTYAQLEGAVNNYLLWIQNQPLFDTAQTRMDQTQQAVSFLESASADPKLQSDFNAAYAAFQSAKQQNAGARNALAQNVSPDQSLALIKQSLDSLSTTYQGFFSVSDDIKQLLPH